MIGKVVTGCVAILPYHTATQDRGSECRDFGFISRIVTALLFMLLYKLIVNAIVGHLNQDIEMSTTQPDRGISTAIRTTKNITSYYCSFQGHLW